MSDNTYDLKPSKEAYQAVKADVTPVSAFSELVDNALDNWRRVLDGLDPITIEIEYHNSPDGNDEIVIRDDSGGVEESDLGILFALGQSKKQNIEGSIGAYGVGAKKAIVNLGNNATIRSRHMYADTGFGFSIDEEWLHDDSDWQVEKVQHSDIDQGITEIRISDLNTPWEKYRDDLIEHLSKTYQRFLDPDKLDHLDSVDIIIREFDSDGNVEFVDEVEPPEKVDWSFTPVEGLYPRRYEGIELNARGLDQEVTLNITVGLMRKASADKAGADIFCQNRQVLSGVTDIRGAFDTGSGRRKLGKFSGQHRRLRVIIEFETEGDAKQLPWDAQKSDIDPYDRVAQAARSWIQRIVRPYYYAAGDYDAVPTTLTRAYDRDSPFAVTEHLEDPYDYSGDRSRVTHKAGTGKSDRDFPQAEAIVNRADVTAILGVYSPGGLDEKFEPAYREEFLRQRRDEFDADISDLEEVTIPSSVVPVADVPDDITEDKAERVLNQLRSKAEDHASKTPPVRSDLAEDWKQVVYDRVLREAIHDRVERLRDQHSEDSEEIDIGLGVSWESEYELDIEQLETIGSETDAEQDGLDEVLTESETDTVVDKSEADKESDSEEIDNDIDQIPGDKDSSDKTTQKPEEVTAEESVDVTDDQGHDSEEETEDKGFERMSTERVLTLEENEWKALVDALNLDEDASSEEVRERLMDTVSTLRDLPTT